MLVSIKPSLYVLAYWVLGLQTHTPLCLARFYSKCGPGDWLLACCTTAWSWAPFSALILAFVWDGVLLCPWPCSSQNWGYRHVLFSDAWEVGRSAWTGDYPSCPQSPPKPPTMWWVDPQVDGHRGDAFVGPRDPVGLRFDLLPDFIKVCKLFGLAVQKLGIFWHGKKTFTVRKGCVRGRRMHRARRVPGREKWNHFSSHRNLRIMAFVLSFILSGWFIFWNSLTM